MTGGPCTGKGDPGRWLKPQDLADLLGMSKGWVQEQVTARAIWFHPMGRVTRFCPECVEKITRATAVTPTDVRATRRSA